MPSKIIKKLRPVLEKYNAGYQESRCTEELMFWKRSNCLEVVKYIYKHHRKFYYQLDFTGNSYKFDNAIHGFYDITDPESGYEYYYISWVKDEYRERKR